MAANEKKVQVVVSVDDEHMPEVGEVAQRCRKAGLQVDQALGEVGIITGSIPEDKLKKLSGVKGVASVEREQTYQIPPPGSDIQ
jgi:methylmalonyl-CoA mutase cobalamin-binding subunit